MSQSRISIYKSLKGVSGTPSQAWRPYPIIILNYLREYLISWTLLVSTFNQHPQSTCISQHHHPSPGPVSQHTHTIQHHQPATSASIISKHHQPISSTSTISWPNINSQPVRSFRVSLSHRAFQNFSPIYEVEIEKFHANASSTASSHRIKHDHQAKLYEGSYMGGVCAIDEML